MTRFRTVTLIVVALVATGICVRLGIWQLDRLEERRAGNARTAASLAGPPVDIATLSADSAASGRRVVIRGSYDFDHEIVLVNRSRDGAPGVNLLTPLRIAGRDSAVMVNRGWIYSPDGATIDRAVWREPADASGVAYVSWPTVTPGATPIAVPMDSNRRLFRADPARLAAAVPYPVVPYQLVLLADATAQGAGYGGASPADGGAPVRLSPPPLDEGPHKSYAIQWFAFATIIVVGTAALVASERTRARVRGNGRVPRVRHSSSLT